MTKLMYSDDLGNEPVYALESEAQHFADSVARECDEPSFSSAKWLPAEGEREIRWLREHRENVDWHATVAAQAQINTMLGLPPNPITLQDWHNDAPITYLWFTSIGCPTGYEFRHNVDTDDDDEYCDFADIDLDDMWCLLGAIDANGAWCWNGEGNPTDWQGNSILNIKARRD